MIRRLALPACFAALALVAFSVHGCGGDDVANSGEPANSSVRAPVPGDELHDGPAPAVLTSRPLGPDPAGPPATWYTGERNAFVEPAAIRDRAGRLWIAAITFDAAPGGRIRGRLVAGIAGASGVARWLEITDDLPAAPRFARSGDGVFLVYEAGGAPRRIVGRELRAAADPGPERTIAEGRVLLPDVAEVAPGELAVAYQVLDGTNYRVRIARGGGEGFGEAKTLDVPGLDLWRPRLASSGDGTLHAVLDRFDGASFDVLYARLADGDMEWQEVANGPAYEGLPDLDLAPDGTLWIVWETSPEFGEIGGLRAERSLRVAAIPDADTASSLRHVPASHLPDPRLRTDFPRIAATANGVVVTARAPGRSFVPKFATEYAPFYTSWYTHVFTLRAEGAPDHVVLAATDGDGEATDTLVANDDGTLTDVFAADLRTRRRPKAGAFEEAVEWYWRLGSVELLGPTSAPPLEASRVPSERMALSRPALRARATSASGETLLLGDLHRHTMVSRCQGAEDGTRLDVHRYARGPGTLDFVSVTDHYQHLMPWAHWRGLRDVERFHAPGSLVTLAGMERALRERAHVNEIYRESSDVSHDIGSFVRGHETSPAGVGVDDVIAIPHMVGMNTAPFPWKTFQSDLHRLVEVFQGLRGGYEGPGLPYEAMNRSVDASSLAEGLRRGKEFGLIAASDHRSSSTAYAGAWAQDATRDGIFDALRARRTFATTTPRAWVDATLGELRMGESGGASATEPLRVTVGLEGDQRVATVELLKNGERAQLLQGDGDREIVVVSCRRYQVLSSSDESALTLRARDGEIVSARVRTAGESGATLELEDGTVRLGKRIPWIDVALEIDGAKGAVLELAQGGVRDEVRISDIPVGRSIKRPNRLDRESIWRVGPAKERAEQSGTRTFQFADLERRPGDAYYVRVVLANGDLLWTSPIRVTEIVE